MKQCEKCGNQFPGWATIEGKRKNLNNRKFCLQCSPFGQHNTRNLNKESKRRVVNGNRQPYSEWSDEAKEDNRARIFLRGWFRKKQLVEQHGGCCEKCGYNRCMRALHFHHVDPKQKSFTLDSRTIQTKNWQLVQKESQKCQLLCSNCHMEAEDDISLESKYLKHLPRLKHLFE